MIGHTIKKARWLMTTPLSCKFHHILTRIGHKRIVLTQLTKISEEGNKWREKKVAQGTFREVYPSSIVPFHFFKASLHLHSQKKVLDGLLPPHRPRNCRTHSIEVQWSCTNKLRRFSSWSTTTTSRLTTYTSWSATTTPRLNTNPSRSTVDPPRSTPFSRGWSSLLLDHYHQTIDSLLALTVLFFVILFYFDLLIECMKM